MHLREYPQRSFFLCFRAEGGQDGMRYIDTREREREREKRGRKGVSGHLSTQSQRIGKGQEILR